MLAVLLWVFASAGFAFYVGNFASYNNIYGSLAGVVVFLVWLWISNLAVLLGAEFDAELARGSQIARGTRTRRDRSSRRVTPAPWTEQPACPHVGACQDF